MSLHTEVAALIAARKMVAEQTEPLILMLKDTSIDLEDRWNAFIELVTNDVLTSIDGYGDGFIDTLGDNMTLYDDFNCDRHTTMMYPDMYDRVMEAEEENDWDESLFNAQKNITEWQEQVLAAGKAGFVHDW